MTYRWPQKPITVDWRIGARFNKLQPWIALAEFFTRRCLNSLNRFRDRALMFTRRLIPSWNNRSFLLIKCLQSRTSIAELKHVVEVERGFHSCRKKADKVESWRELDWATICHKPSPWISGHSHTKLARETREVVRSSRQLDCKCKELKFRGNELTLFRHWHLQMIISAQLYTCRSLNI